MGVRPYNGVPLYILHSATVKNKCKSKLPQMACYFVSVISKMQNTLWFLLSLSFETSQKSKTKALTADFVAINHVFITMCLPNKSRLMK